jgi:hypothetical protein
MIANGPDAFERRYGFPRSQVDLGNWRARPWSAWSFQHVSELVPSALVQPGGTPDGPVECADLLARPVVAGGRRLPLSAFLAASCTDAFVLMKRGRTVIDHAASTCDPDLPHLVFSISKSLTAILAGILQGRRLLDPDCPLVDYVPETAGGAYGDCTVRHLLDMRASVDFDEADADPQGPFARYRRVMLWNPGTGGETMLEFLASLRKGTGPHGGPFRYLSPNTDLLGIVIERIAGRRLPDLLRDWLLQPVGATGPCLVTVDSAGTARAAGGIAMTARDLARVGEMMRTGGMAGSRPLLSEAWVRDTTGGGDAEAWRTGEFAERFPGWSYRSHWYRMDEPDDAFCAAGIHGQWLYVDPQAEAVIVRLSSQPQPVDEALDRQSLEVFRQVARMA